MASQMKTVRKGESFPFAFDMGGDSISDFTCTIEARKYPGDTPAVSRAIAPSANGWSGFLTSAETDSLNQIGEWMLVGVITNTAGDREATPLIRFHLAESLLDTTVILPPVFMPPTNLSLLEV